MILKPQIWDSDFFGLKIAKLEVSSANDEIQLIEQQKILQEQFDLIYVFSPTKIEALAEDTLKDCKIVYTQKVKPANYHQQIWKYARLTYVSDDLLHLALTSGEYSRFQLDKNFPKNSYERLYTQWIEKSIDGTLASEVFCYVDNDKPCGLLTLDVKNNNAIIGLVATTLHYRGKGVASALLSHALQYVFDKNITTISVSTQATNLAACSLYEKNGFAVATTKYIYHLWSDKYMQSVDNQQNTPPESMARSLCK